jgi:hypothetical protein
MTRAWVEQQMLRCRVLGPKFPKKKALRQLIVVVERWGVVVIIERGEQATGPPRVFAGGQDLRAAATKRRSSLFKF